MKAVVVRQHGGPEVLTYQDTEVAVPGAGEVRLRTRAIGVNYIDTYQRTGLYPIKLPFTLGMEAAGIVDAVGSGVDGVGVGDAVVHVMQSGAYAELVVVPASKVARVPAGVELETAAALALQGLTAHYLSHSTYPLQAGKTALVLAAAGGVGLLLVQMAKRLGATVLGAVSTDAKAELASVAGCEHVIRYDQTDFKAEVLRLTDGRGVDVVYDSVAAATYRQSLGCLARRGYLVLYGNSSGAVTSVDPRDLNKGSLFLTRPTLVDYAADHGELERRANDLFTWFAAGELSVRIHERYPLAEAERAHRDLESRSTSGKLLLIP